MEITELDKKDAEFLHIYMGLDDESKRLVEYVTRIGASEIFSDREYGDFLELLKK